MTKSNFNPNDNTFEVLLNSGVKVTGTYKVLIISSNSFCNMSFEVECKKHNPPANSKLDENINFLVAQNQISKKLSEYASNNVQSKIFPKAIEHIDTEELIQMSKHNFN